MPPAAVNPPRLRPGTSTPLRKRPLGLVIDHDEDAVQELVGAIRSVGDLPTLVDCFESWSVKNAHGRKSAGRVIQEPSGPD